MVERKVKEHRRLIELEQSLKEKVRDGINIFNAPIKAFSTFY